MKAKTWILLALACLAGLSAQAYSFTNLYFFSADAFPPGANELATNGDGANPVSIIVANGVIYGVDAGGGSTGDGTIFRMDVDGTHFTNFFTFQLGPEDPGTNTYSQSTGVQPNPGLLLVSNTLYGTTFYGGFRDAGAVFKINTNGSDFVLLHSFLFSDGASPASGLTLYSNTLYGTTVGGGSNGYGVVYTIGPGGFHPVYQFESQINPYGGVVATNTGIFGFNEYDTELYAGGVYQIGSGGYHQLFQFNQTNGANPWGSPLLYNGVLYGATYEAAANGSGAIFRVNIDGSGFTNIHSFSTDSFANTDGALPYDFSGPTLSGGKLYVTTSLGGSGHNGVVSQMNLDGSAFTVLHSFEQSDGSQPVALAYANGVLYGAAEYGGYGVSLADGSIFAITLQAPPPTLNIVLTNGQAVITWNDQSYSLYRGDTANDISILIPAAASPYTYGLNGTSEFFELRKSGD